MTKHLAGRRYAVTCLSYCFPKNCGDVVAKTRLATEELYKLTRAEKRAARVEE